MSEERTTECHTVPMQTEVRVCQTFVQRAARCWTAQWGGSSWREESYLYMYNNTMSCAFMEKMHGGGWLHVPQLSDANSVHLSHWNPWTSHCRCCQQYTYCSHWWTNGMDRWTLLPSLLLCSSWSPKWWIAHEGYIPPTCWVTSVIVQSTTRDTRSISAHSVIHRMSTTT